MENKNVKNDIIVLNYNDYKTCISFVSEILDYSCVDVIIIVDNKSTDNSYQILLKIKSEKVIVIQTEENKGYAYGNNVGMKFAVDNFSDLKNIIISNPDIHVKEKDFNDIVSKLSDGYGMSTGLIYNYNNKSLKKELASNFGWKIPSYKDMIANCFLLLYKIKRSIFRSSIYLDFEKVKDKDIISTEAVPGCFFALSVDAAKQIDYMDENTFLYGEETILGWKLKEKGYKACIVNNTEILHENSISISKSIKCNKKKAKIRMNSELIYIKKYLKCGHIKVALFVLAYKVGYLEKMIIHRLIRK